MKTGNKYIKHGNLTEFKEYLTALQKVKRCTGEELTFSELESLNDMFKNILGR